MKNLKTSILLLFALFSGFGVRAQTKVGDKWVDNNLSFAVVDDRIHQSGIFSICIMDTTKNFCVENLQTGFEVKILNSNKEQLWEGIATGRTFTVRLPHKMEDAEYVAVKAFKPYVVNKLTRTRIYQDKPIQTIYKIQ